MSRLYFKMFWEIQSVCDRLHYTTQSYFAGIFVRHSWIQSEDESGYCNGWYTERNVCFVWRGKHYLRSRLFEGCAFGLPILHLWRGAHAPPRYSLGRTGRPGLCPNLYLACEKEAKPEAIAEARQRPRGGPERSEDQPVSENSASCQRSTNLPIGIYSCD
jgi:hypothetical protein